MYTAEQVNIHNKTYDIEIKYEESGDDYVRIAVRDWSKWYPVGIFRKIANSDIFWKAIIEYRGKEYCVQFNDYGDKFELYEYGYSGKWYPTELANRIMEIYE